MKGRKVYAIDKLAQRAVERLHAWMRDRARRDELVDRARLAMREPFDEQQLERRCFP